MNATDVLEAMIREALPEQVTLAYADRGDRLTVEQVQTAIREGSDAVREEMWEWCADSAYHGEGYYLEDLPDLLRESIADDPNLDYFAREVLRGRDDSDLFGEVLRLTPSMLFRYDLDHEGDDPDELGEALGLSPDVIAANRDGILSALAETAYYGGHLAIIWYGDPLDVVTATDRAHYGEAPATISWDNPRVLIRDGLNGSGWDFQFTGTVTLPFEVGRVTTDEKGPGYSWTEIAGPYEPAYDCTVRFA